MTGAGVFVLDANVFIQAANEYYAFDLVPAFWNTLVKHAQAGRLLSIDRVRDELLRQKDQLSEWADGPFRPYFVSTDCPGVLDVYKEVVEWACSQKQFSDQAKEDFAQAENADAWVVAYAKACACVVVTQEKLRPDVRRKVPVPNACEAFGVPYVNTFEMLRRLGVAFT